MVYVDDSSLKATHSHSPRRLAWSNGQQPLGAILDELGKLLQLLVVVIVVYCLKLPARSSSAASHLNNL